MSRKHDLNVQKRRVRRTLNTGLHAKKQAQRAAEATALDATIATWSQFKAKFGSFSDEHSSL